MFGVGLPVAEHSKRTGAPFFTCKCPPDVTWDIFAGTNFTDLQCQSRDEDCMWNRKKSIKMGFYRIRVDLKKFKLLLTQIGN